MHAGYFGFSGSFPLMGLVLEREGEGERERREKLKQYLKKYIYLISLS